MIELRPTGQNSFALGYGGDTLNTAVYLARLGQSVDYVTRLGSDEYSNNMLSEWAKEGVGVDLIEQCENRLPGMYVINNDDQGERFFTYWRKESPARELFDDSPQVLFKQLIKFEYLYITGISLSLYQDEARQTLFDFLDQYRSKGGRVVFDVNYRPANWSNKEQAQSTVLSMLKRVDIALPSFDDEQALFGFSTTDECIEHYLKNGVNDVVLKDGLRGCTHASKGHRQHYCVIREISPVDTTAAGDSFNAGFLAALLDSQSIEVAIAKGQACASLVIQHPGAIIDGDIFNKDLLARNNYNPTKTQSHYQNEVQN